MNPMRKAAVAFLLFTIFAIPWQTTVVLPGFGTLAKFLGIGAFLFAFGSLPERGRLRIRPPSLGLVAAALFVVWLLISYFWSFDPHTSRIAVMQYIQLLGLVWVVWELGRTRWELMAMAQALVLGAYVTAIHIIVIFVTTQHLMEGGRITTVGANQNDLATMLAISIAFAWWLITRRGSWFFFVVNLLFLPVGIAGILLTGSRGGTLEAALALVAIPLTLTRLGMARQLLLVLLIAGLAVGASRLPGQYVARAMPDLQRVSGSAADLTDSNLNYRTVIWRAGLQVLERRPIVGYGVESFSSVIAPILGTEWAPHNTFLAIAVGSGLIGLTLFLLTLVLAAVPLLLFGRTRRDVAMLFVFITLVVGMMPLGWEYNKITWFVIGFMSAAHGVAVWPHGRRFALRERRPPALTRGTERAS